MIQLHKFVCFMLANADDCYQRSNVNIFHILSYSIYVVPGSGTIEPHEFVNVMLDKMQMMDTEDEIKKVFRVFDRDGNGFINAAELRYITVLLFDH